MVFGFFSRKPQVAGPTPMPSSSTPFTFPNINAKPTNSHTQLHTPAPSISFSYSNLPVLSEFPSGSPPPPVTPSPPPPNHNLITDPKALYTLISSVPAQTLHSYCLSNLNPATFNSGAHSPKSKLKQSAMVDDHDLEQPDVPDLSPTPSDILTALTSFFSTLVPPPQLHCARCHKFYFELDNSDTSCRVQHDDDSAIVDRVSGGGVGSGKKAAYETLWGCCEKVVEGDGDQGPPDGWCYEGRHTTDSKRARFRADSTPHDDKLSSCAQMRCFAPPPSHSSRSSRSGVKRKRTAASKSPVRGRTVREGHEEDEDTKENEKGEDEQEDVRSNASGSVKRRRKASTISTSKKKKAHKQVAGEDAMDVDAQDVPLPLPPTGATPHSPPASPRSRPQPKPRKKPNSRAAAIGATAATTATTPTKRSPLSASFVVPAEGRTSPSPIRPLKAYVEIRQCSKSPTRPGSSGLGGKGSVGSLRSMEVEVEKTNLKKRGRKASVKAVESDGECVNEVTRGRKGRGRGKGKALDEVVDTSVDAEKWA